MRRQRVERDPAGHVLLARALEAFLVRMLNVVGAVAGAIVEGIVRLQNRLVRSNRLPHGAWVLQKVGRVGGLAAEGSGRGDLCERESRCEECWP